MAPRCPEPGRPSPAAIPSPSPGSGRRPSSDDPPSTAGAPPDYDVFKFPTINPGYQRAVTVGADVPVMVSDTPAARSFMTYLASARAQETWIKLGGFTSVNRSVSADTYLDPVARTVAEELTEAEVTRFSAGDMMPTSLQRAWWGAMLDLVKDPSDVDSILDRLTAAANSAR